MLEIDGASNNGVEQVRELRQNVNFRPSRSRYKIYIIDEVHMLTTAAFNALLKTLEEPPAHVKFIFATTEVTEDPRHDPVALSAVRFRRHRPGTHRRAAAADRRQSKSMEADDEALHLIARRAGGSMRDAQSLLDQLLSFGSDTSLGRAGESTAGHGQRRTHRRPGLMPCWKKMPLEPWSCVGAWWIRACSWANCSISSSNTGAI